MRAILPAIRCRRVEYDGASRPEPPPPPPLPTGPEPVGIWMRPLTVGGAAPRWPHSPTALDARSPEEKREDADRLLQCLSSMRTEKVPPPLSPVTELSPALTAEVLVNEAAVVRAAVEARRTIPAEEDIRDHDGAIMPELTMQATQEILREADLILALCKANTKPRRTNCTGMSTSEQHAYVQRWQPEVDRLERERSERRVRNSGVSESLVHSFGRDRVERGVLLSTGNSVRGSTSKSYLTYVRDYVCFCHDMDWRNPFLEGEADVQAISVIHFFMEHQEVWRGSTRIGPSTAALRKWFEDNGIPRATVAGWFEGERVSKVRQEIRLRAPLLEQMRKKLDNRRQLVTLDYCHLSRAIYGVAYTPFDIECPFTDCGRREFMMSTCLHFAMAYGLRSANLVYTSKEAFFQLITEETIYVRVSIPGSGVTETIFSHQFDSFRRKHWFTPRVVQSWCLVFPFGKNFGPDKPSHAEALTIPIVAGRSPLTDLLMDMLFRHSCNAHHRLGDVYFSLNSTRQVRGEPVIKNSMLTEPEMTDHVKVLGILQGHSPTNRTFYSCRDHATTALALAQDVQGVPYYQTVMHWKATSSAEHYLHGDVRPTNALDVAPLPSTAAHVSVLPDSSRCPWTKLIMQDGQRNWPAQVAVMRSHVNANLRREELGRDQVPERTNAAEVATVAGVESDPEAPVLSQEQIRSLTQRVGEPLSLPSRNLSEDDCIRREHEAIRQAQAHAVAKVNDDRTGQAWRMARDRVCQQGEITDDTDEWNEGPDAVAYFNREARQVKFPSRDTVELSVARVSPHRALTLGGARNLGEVKAREEIKVCLEEPSGIFFKGVDTVYSHLKAAERFTPTMLTWTPLTLSDPDGMPLEGSSYSNVWVAACDREEKQKKEVCRRFVRIAKEGHAQFSERVPHERDLTASLQHCAAARFEGGYAYADVGSWSRDGLIRGPDGVEMLNPIPEEGRPYFAIHKGIHGYVPIITQSWVYAMHWIMEFDHTSGLQSVSFPPGTMMKSGFMSQVEALHYAEKGVDLRPIAPEHAIVEPCPLERIG